MQHKAKNIPHKTYRHARILATLGPASRDKETIRALVDAGVNAFRLNFSHGSADDHRGSVEAIRQIEEEIGRPLTILQDLQGPKIRLGELEGSELINLETGATFVLDDNPEKGNAQRAHLPHPEVLSSLQVDDKIYINDGLVQLTVTKAEKGKVTCHVEAGGPIGSRKGINLPTVDLPMSALTAKDKKDVKVGMELGVDWVALSFVQRAQDVIELRDMIGDSAWIMAKIEKPNAVDRIDDIIEAANGIMVARGDLGVEVPLEEVPSIQKRIIRKCRRAGKPVVVATQMLESMTTNASPTRAEVSDVANATYEGADALMLSAETASGDYPVRVVEVMDSIIRRVERSNAWRPIMDASHPKTTPQVGDAITAASAKVADELAVKAIVTMTDSGSSALRMSRQRPMQPIICLTHSLNTARRVGLAWGIKSRVSTDPKTFSDTTPLVIDAMKAEKVGKAGDHVILVAGVPFGVRGSTNMLRVITL